MENPMIKFVLKQTGEASIEIDCTTVELFVGVLVLIKSIFQNMMLNDGEKDAKWFKEQIAEALTNPENPLYKEAFGGAGE